MASSCIHDLIRDLLLRINSDHILYLSENDLSLKLKYRNSLQKYIHELLCVVPHHQKFNFSETAEVLHRSIQKIKAGNFLKLINSWVALAAYANNLFSQPWRKEFHEITTYCGYYKHQVENYLIGAEKMLKLMGYQRKSSDCQLIFNISTDPKLICAVSLDCLIALTECQVIFAVHQEISKHLPASSLADVLEFRQARICSVEDAVQGICYLYASHCRDDCCCCNNDAIQRCCKVVENNTKRPSKCLTTAGKNGYRACCSHVTANTNTTNSFTANSNASKDGSISYRYKKKDVGDYSSVPTAKLINIDYNNGSDLCYIDNNYHHRRQNCDRQRTRSMQRLTESKHISNNNNNNNVNSSNNNNKRQVDNSTLIDSNAHRSNSTIFDEYSGYKIDSNNNSSSGISRINYVAKKDKDSTRDRCKDKQSLPSNVGESKIVKYSNGGSSEYNSTSAKLAIISESLQGLKLTNDRSSPSVDSKIKPSSHRDRGGSEDIVNGYYYGRIKTNNGGASVVEGWECNTCTYRNSKKNRVCEMCGKSRSAGNEAKPLISGGKQCPHCTLVNSKDAVSCEACSNSLKDSPTYI